jgi:hypothetical protein
LILRGSRKALGYAFLVVAMERMAFSDRVRRGHSSSAIGLSPAGDAVVAKVKSDHIAFVSLALALMSTASTIFQWWSSGREERIRAAVDISNSYLEKAVSDPNHILSASQFGFASQEQAFSALRELERLEFVAYLANRGLVNANYLSHVLTCNIVRMTKDPEGEPNPASEAQTFARGQNATCADTDLN